MANPFGQMKDLYKMQKEAKEMQKKLQAIQITGTSKDGGVTIFMNGAQEFEDIKLSDEMLELCDQDRLRKGMKEAFKDFQKKLQKRMMQDLDIDSLRGMLGG